jgi:hypothetical protein
MDLDLENVDFSDNEEEHDVEIPVSEPSGLIEFSLDTQGELLRDNVEKSKKRKSVLRAQFTQDDMRTAIGIHYSELKEAVDRTRRLANCCCDEELSGIMLSILPENLVDPPREHTTFELSALGHLRALLSWFGDSFTLVPDMDVSEEEGWDGLGHDELLHGIDSRSGSRTQLTQLFAALLQGLTATFDTAEVGVFVRLAATLDPMPCQASLIPGLKEQRLAEAAERRCVASSQSSTAHERESTHRPATDAQGEDNSRVRIGNRLHADTRRSTGLLRSSAGLLIPRDIKRIRDNYNNENYSGSSSSSSSSSDGSGSGSSSSSDLQIDSSNHSTVHLNSPVNALETVATCSSYRPTHKTCVWLEILLSMPYSSAVQNTERRKANPRLTGPRQGGNKEATSNTAEAREEAKACAPASSAKAPLESLGSVSGPEGAPSSASLVDLTGDSDCDTGVSHDPGTRCAPPESQAQARAQGPDCLTRWVSVDVASGTVDCPEWVERERGGGSTGTVAYVCAVPLPPSTVASPLAPESLPALDVTRRYAASYRAACQQRLERALPAAARWLDSVFSRQANGPEVARSAVYHSVDSSGSSNGSGSGGRRGDGDFLAAAGMTEQEKAELEARAYNEAVPTNLAGFKNHPRYALGRLLGSTQAFDPAKKRLLHVWKGEMVYNREAVSEVLSASQWKRKGMQVPKMIFDTDDTDDTDYIEDWKWKHQEVVPSTFLLQTTNTLISFQWALLLSAHSISHLTPPSISLPAR